MNITLIGMPGSGKSYIGKMASEKLGYRLVELDRLIEEDYKMPLQKIIDTIGEEAFLKAQEKIALSCANAEHDLVISPGGSIIYSDLAMRHLKKVSKVIYLKTSLETIRKRIAETPRNIIGSKEKDLEGLFKERTALHEKWADVVLDAERDSDEIIEDIKKLFS